MIEFIAGFAAALSVVALGVAYRGILRHDRTPEADLSPPDAVAAPEWSREFLAASVADAVLQQSEYEAAHGARQIRRMLAIRNEKLRPHNPAPGAYGSDQRHQAVVQRVLAAHVRAGRAPPAPLGVIGAAVSDALTGAPRNAN